MAQMTSTVALPRAVKTLGTLNLVFAGLGVLGLVMTYAMYFGGLHLSNDPVRDLAVKSPEYMSFMKASMVAGAISHIALGSAGWGLLHLRSWGRKLTIGYAVYAILASIGALVMVQHYVLGPLAQHSSNAAVKGGAIGGLFGGIIALAYPIILLIFMSKQNIRDAFDRANEPPVPPAQVR